MTQKPLSLFASSFSYIFLNVTIIIARIPKTSTCLWFTRVFSVCVCMKDHHITKNQQENKMYQQYVYVLLLQYETLQQRLPNGLVLRCVCELMRKHIQYTYTWCVCVCVWILCELFRIVHTHFSPLIFFIQCLVGN